MSERGAASVEHVALALLAAALMLLAVAAAGSGDLGTERLLGSKLAQKQRCAVRYPDPCWEDPLKEAYGRELAGAVRALAPRPEPRAGPDGVGLVGVDFRRCRGVRCATPRPGPEGSRLTLSNRRTAAFTTFDIAGPAGPEVRPTREDEEARAPGSHRIDYWIYRPTLGWERVSREVDADEIRALAGTPLHDSANPKLVPLETLLGRDEARFAADEEPPWRGRVESRWGR